MDARIKLPQRIFSLISYSATEKYFEFQKTCPNVFNKVPLYMIASYLEILRETLGTGVARYPKEGFHIE